MTDPVNRVEEKVGGKVRIRLLEEIGWGRVRDFVRGRCRDKGREEVVG